jgi:hypothetical protein
MQINRERRLALDDIRGNPVMLADSALSPASAGLAGDFPAPVK